MLFDLGCELVYLEVVRETVPPIEPWAFLGFAGEPEGWLWELKAGASARMAYL